MGSSITTNTMNTSTHSSLQGDFAIINDGGTDTVASPPTTATSPLFGGDIVDIDEEEELEHQERWSLL